MTLLGGLTLLVGLVFLGAYLVDRYLGDPYVDFAGRERTTGGHPKATARPQVTPSVAADGPTLHAKGTP